MKRRAEYKRKSFEKQKKRGKKALNKANVTTDKGKWQTLIFTPVEQMAAKTSVFQIILKTAKQSLNVYTEVIHTALATRGIFSIASYSLANAKWHQIKHQAPVPVFKNYNGK